MEQIIVAKEMLSVEEYVQKIKTKKIYHNELPEEIRGNLSVIHAQIYAKTRLFGNRGYDVIRNRFFVHQSIKEKNYYGEIVDRDDTVTFESFDEYYSYLDGDIYNQACYYQYNFPREIINGYCIDVNKISCSPFVEDTLQLRSKEVDKLDKEVLTKAKRNKATLLKWKDKFCACYNYDDLIKVVKAFSKSHLKEWDYVLSSYALYNKVNNIPLLIKLLLETDYFKSDKFLAMLCVEYGDDSIFDCFNRYYWKRKSKIKSYINGLASGAIIEKYSKYYDENTDFLCIRKYIMDPKGTRFARCKGYIVYYYETFDSFSKACNFDLSDAKLSNAIVNNVDFSKFVISDLTELPLRSIENPYYYVNKYYDAKKDSFVVAEEWRANINSPILKKREYHFEQLVDFVAFLEGDLSGADLLLCDGLSHVSDFSTINLEGALIVSYIKEKAGLLKENDIFSLPNLDMIQSTASTELMYINEEVALRPELSYFEQRQHKKIHYISDLHLPHHIQEPKVKTKEDVTSIIKRIVLELTQGILEKDILLIVGDTSYDLLYFQMFVSMLREATKAKIVFVLGNHELWGFERMSFSDTVRTYKEILANHNMYLLQNNIVYSMGEDEPLQVISEEELVSMDTSLLRTALKCAPIILFGGLACSGLNKEFNAENAIYRKGLTREEEIEESRKFETLYTKVRDTLVNREVVIATHMPLNDWSHDVEHHGGYIYVSGHTHRNEFFDDGIKRIYADNQVGYYRKHFNAKYFNIDGNYDLFDDYNDGIYEITRSEYADFYRGKNIQMDFNRDFEQLYMLKQKGYYCFIIQTSKGKFSILNGGATKIINNKTIESCYDEMSQIIESVKTPLDAFTSVQKQVSDFVKSIGGDGRIHGAIVDIDFWNHIYVNPNDLKVTGYFALSMVDKMVFGSIENLLTQCRPDLLPAYNKYLSGDSTTALVLKQNADNTFVSKPYYSTDIYKNSNILKKMQRLYSNILTVWPEKGSSIVMNIDKQKMLKDNLNK